MFNANDQRVQEFLGRPSPEVQSAFSGIQELLDESSEASDDQIKQILMRIHKNCGHPSPALLHRILSEAKAPAKVIALSKQLDCPVCARLKRLTPARPTNTLRGRGNSDKLFRLTSVITILINASFKFCFTLSMRPAVFTGQRLL